MPAEDLEVFRCPWCWENYRGVVWRKDPSSPGNPELVSVFKTDADGNMIFTARQMKDETDRRALPLWKRITARGLSVPVDDATLEVARYHLNEVRAQVMASPEAAMAIPVVEERNGILVNAGLYRPETMRVLAGYFGHLMSGPARRTQG